MSTDGSPELRELSDNLNDMVVNLRHLSAEVRGGAHSVGTAATEILATASEQGSSLTEQSAAISQTSATAEELRAAAEHTAGRARDVADQAQAAAQASDEGHRGGGRHRRRHGGDPGAGRGDRPGHPHPLRADPADRRDHGNRRRPCRAVQPAGPERDHRSRPGRRAGTRLRGRRRRGPQPGRAVQAGTGQVRAILSDIQKATNEAVLATEQGIKVVERGRGRAQRAGEVIGQLGDTVRDTAQAAQQIAASAHEQRIAVDQIAVAMREINQATNQFVTGAADSRSAAEGLGDLARQLKALTERYRVEVG